MRFSNTVIEYQTSNKNLENYSAFVLVYVYHAQGDMR